MTEYLNGQGKNKPVETHPYELREWEPTIKAAMDRMEKMKQEATKYLGCRPCEGERFAIGGLHVAGARAES